MRRQIALIVANSRYDDPGLPPLEAPASDAEALSEILLDPQISAFDEVRVLVDEPLRDVQKAVVRLFAERDEDDVLLLYYSGHGLRDSRGRLFFATRDTELETLHATALAAAFVSDEMDSSHSARKVTLLDCCNSGSSGSAARGAKSVATLAMGASHALRGNAMGRAILAASDATELAFEDTAEGTARIAGEAPPSLFTRFFVEGIKTGAAKREADGRGILLEEAFDYAHEQVLRTDRGQTPQRWFYRLGGDVVLARHSVADSGATTDQRLDALADAAREMDDTLRNLEAELRRGVDPGPVVARLERLRSTAPPAMANLATDVLGRYYRDLGDAARRTGDALEAELDYRRALGYLEAGKGDPALREEIATRLRRARAIERLGTWIARDGKILAWGLVLLLAGFVSGFLIALFLP